MTHSASQGTPALSVSIRPEFSTLNREAPGESHLLLSLAGRQPAATEQRKPLRLAIAADLSGSMSGDKMEYLRASLLALVNQLTAADQVAIVAFSTSVWTIAPPTACGESGRATLDTLIDTMEATQSTNLSGGALEAIATLRRMMDAAG